MTCTWFQLCLLWALRAESSEGGCTQLSVHCTNRNIHMLYKEQHTKCPKNELLFSNSLRNLEVLI